MSVRKHSSSAPRAAAAAAAAAKGSHEQVLDTVEQGILVRALQRRGVLANVCWSEEAATRHSLVHHETGSEDCLCRSTDRRSSDHYG